MIVISVKGKTTFLSLSSKGVKIKVNLLHQKIKFPPIYSASKQAGPQVVSSEFNLNSFT